MTEGYVSVSLERIAAFGPDITLYKTNIIVSIVCLLFVLMNLMVLGTNRVFLRRYKHLITLNCSYIIVLAGVLLEAVARLSKYAKIAETQVAPVVNSRDCIEVWALVQVYADFIMPSIQVIMGLERFIAVKCPSFYRITYHRAFIYFVVAAIAGAAVATGIPAAISAISPTPNVRVQCGRKAAFGLTFGVIDYAFNVVMISTALTLNVATCVKAMAIQQSPSSMRKIKCYTGIAVVSTVLVSVPNLFSIIHAMLMPLPDALMTPAPILACLNCFLQFFINFAMNDEYRARFLRILTIGHYRPIEIASVQNDTTKMGSADRGQRNSHPCSI